MLKTIAVQRGISVNELVIDFIGVAIDGLDEIPEEQIKPVTIAKKVFGLTNYSDYNNSRKREYVSKRDAAMTLQYLFCNLTLVDVGNNFGKDHSTVSIAVRRVRWYIDSGDIWLKEAFDPMFSELHYQFRKKFKDRKLMTPKAITDLYRISERLDRFGFKNYRP